jgi:hypothetical protein
MVLVTYRLEFLHEPSTTAVGRLPPVGFRSDGRQLCAQNQPVSRRFSIAELERPLYKRTFTGRWFETMPGGSSLDRTGGIQLSRYLPRQS